MPTPPDALSRLAELPGVGAAVGAARDAVDAVLSHRILRTRSAEVTAEVSLRAARASAALSGADHALADLRAGALDPPDPVVLGALRISAHLGELAATWPRAPRQALARLHALAAADAAEPDVLGRPRETDRPDEITLVPPPPAAALPGRLDGLFAVVDSPAPAVVVAAVVHGELLTLSPFGWGNGLIARAASRLVLISRGLDPKAVTAPEVGHREAATDYRASVVGYADGTTAGVTGWLVHCAEAVRLGAREGLAVAEALRRSDQT